MQRYFLLQLYILQDLSAAAVTFRDLQGPAESSPRDNKAISPSFDGAVAAREAAPRRSLKTACHWHPSGACNLQKHFESRQTKETACESSDDYLVT